MEEDRALVEGDWAEIEFKGEIKPLVQAVTEEGLTATEPAAEPITGEDVLIEIGARTRCRRSTRRCAERRSGRN